MWIDRNASMRSKRLRLLLYSLLSLLLSLLLLLLSSLSRRKFLICSVFFFWVEWMLIVENRVWPGDWDGWRLPSAGVAWLPGWCQSWLCFSLSADRRRAYSNSRRCPAYFDQSSRYDGSKSPEALTPLRRCSLVIVVADQIPEQIVSLSILLESVNFVNRTDLRSMSSGIVVFS